VLKTFRCTCGNSLYFENSRCLACGRPLGYVPDDRQISALEPEADGLWRALANGRRYRQCRNYHQYQVCNWMVPEAESENFCISCRLNHVIPNLSEAENLSLWFRIEAAKRRLLYGLTTLGLPITGRRHDPHHGLAFQFLANVTDNGEFDNDISQQHVLTGHLRGMITINILEARSSAREEMREKMNERYRTLLGHFRHESGHFYWQRLVQSNRDWLARFRALFGDERGDYQAVMQRYYAQGPLADWQANYISAYASSHPWEDWAETWAHYLHMIDTLETAVDYGFSATAPHVTQPWQTPASFDELVAEWGRLSVALNALNRSMGVADAYPFSITPGVADKLCFVHELVAQSRVGVTNND
jgi:hypothetical protein